MKWCAYILCLCIAAVYANPNALKDPFICGSPSCIPSDKFNYSLKVIYKYEYKVSINTWFAGSTNNQSTLDVKSIASVQFFTPCEGLLQLSDVSLKDQDENYPVERAEKFTQALSQRSLRFAFHDGIISEICPEFAEDDWVLNYKRGILSLFQSTMQRFDINFKGIERDIHGTCNVDYTIREQEGTSLIVIKSRDLTQCTDRYKYMSILQTVRYNFQSKFQTWPVLSSESKCRIAVDHKVYRTVNCRERHLFEPFSGKQSGAMTTVIQDLELIEERNKTDSEIMDEQPRSWNEISIRSNLMHYHTQSYHTSTGELKSARDVLKLLCEIRDPDDDSGPASTVDENLDSGSTVGLWGSLVRASRGLDHATLSQLLARAPTICSRATKHILDALPYIASVGSVELIKDMILKGVEEETKNEWLMSMAMIPRPKLPMLKTMLELAENNTNDKVITFTASSMVHSYCKHSGKSLRECCEESVPLEIMQIYERVIVDMKQKGLSDISKKDRNKVLLAIKALGNIGGFKQEFADILMDIIGDTTVLLPIRLAAVDAFRRTPCIETREYFLEMYREDFVDIEVRLASYLQVMRCPDLSTIRKIFHALKHETVNQAATFVWSHLNNLGQSSLPSRVEIQGLLSGNTVPQLDDNPDFRMFSRNYEQSVFFDQYNAGGNYEANVIFTPDSYLPRSVSLNLTVDMFGESINVLELKARGEGFEKYFEQVFGSYGALSKNRLNEYIQNLPRLFTRSINSADEVREKIDQLNYQNEALKHQYPMAEIGLKVFGNEISYWSAEGDDEIRQSLSKLNPQMRILEILSGKEISYNKASLFVDTTYSLPTGCGLPLNMNIMGTSYVNMKMSGTVVDRFSTSGKLDFEGKIHPSVALNVAATMGVVAGTLSSTGIRINMRLYTATAVEAKLKLQGIKLIHLDLSLPHPKQEIFGAKSELIILHGDKEHQQMGLNQNRIERNTCSWSTFDKAIGIKICAAYQFPNMENLKNAPYFLMSGPSKYLISLEKSDPSAKTYSFHYTWDENDTSSRFSFSFDTPNSKEKRLFNSEMTLSQNSSTALMSFQSAESTFKAHGKYKNLEFDKSLEVSLDIDGRKHFDTVMSLKRHDVKFGFVWIPHAYLVVNDERIAELSGSLKAKTKGGVTQWDVQAEFQTKQLASSLIGYYTINGPTYMTKLQLDYKFYNSPKQVIKFEGLYTERSAGYRHDLYAELGMEFTAYPLYNFYTVVRNVKSSSHLDIAVNISDSNALIDQPKFAFSFVRMDGLTNMKLRTQLIITKPKPIKMLFKYRQMGNKYNALALLNVNPKARDIIIAGFLHKPSGTQLFIDGSLNMTLPTLKPMYVNVKVHEKNPKEYQISTVGVWFTGVDFNVDALYWDQSKTNLASHRLKITINSSFFKTIAGDAKFTQDNRQITFVGDGEYNDDQYRALVRYILISEGNFTTHAEVDVNGKAYIVELRADLNNNTNINMDIHVDQLRDLHISYHRWVSGNQKRLSALINWDANRDPSQRVSVDVRLDHKGPLHHAGYLTLYYPGRPINGEFEVLLKDWFCEWHVRMGWSAEDVILWRVKMYSEAHNETVYALLSKMDTPFPGWTDTSFNLMWHYHDNLQALNGSMNWQKDYLAFSLLADYLFRTNEFYGTIHAEVNSTIPTLPKAAAIAKHRLVWKKSADTLLSFQYNDDGILMINSSWLLDRGPRNNNVTGLVTLLTPFPGYKKGLLRTKFVFGDKRDIKGDTFVDLEERSLKISVNGHMRRITNSLLAINVTHPITEYSHMTARFGFIEADRHLVAMVVTPNSTTGIEFLLQLQTIQNFNIFGHVALPIQYLTRAMVTAKRAKEEVDFRVGWDRMNFGFTGIWHYKSPVNFIYLYKLYTPLDGFEENGIVLKNIYGKGLDTEISVRLSKHKFGVAILLVDHGKGVLDAITEAMQREKIDTDNLLDNFDTTASVTLDLLYYPTITFDAHLIKIHGPSEEDILNANATLNLPNKPPIVLTNVFVLEEITVMRNTLHLVTPFVSIQELKSVYNLEIILGEKFNVSCLALLNNGEEKWNEISAKIYYEYETGEDDAYQSYLASLDIVTPLVVLPALDGTVSVRLEDSLWKMSADIGMPSFTINATGRLELDDPFVETSGTLNLTSTNLMDYFIKMEFKKDFSDIENTVGGGIQVLQGEQNNYVFADVKWRPLPSQYVRFKAKAALPPVIPESMINIFYTNNRNDSYKSLATEFKFGENIFYSLNADQRPLTATVALSSPHKGFNTVKILLNFSGDDITGSLLTDKLECGIIGNVLNRTPLDIQLQIIPKGDAEAVKLRIKAETTATTYALSAHLIGGVQVTMHAKADFNSNFTDINFRIDSPVLHKKDMYLKARIDNYPDLRRVMKVQAGTPFKELQYVKCDTDFIFGPKTGYLVGDYDLPNLKGDGDLKWSFEVGDLFIRALGHQTAEGTPRSVDLDIYFGNTTDPEGLNTTKAGFRMDLDKIWLIGANASIGYLVDRRIALVINALLPKPNVDVHTLRIDGDIGSMETPYKSFLASYSTDVTKIVTGLNGRIMLLPTEFQGNASMTWTSNSTINKVDNLLYTTWNENGSHFVDYSLISPLYESEETFKVKGSYDKDNLNNLVLVKGIMHKPGSSQIGEIDVKYGGTRNTKGNFNLTTPFKNLLWLKSNFDIVNGEELSRNKITIHWPNKTASVNTTHQYKKEIDVFSQIGDISLELPLNTKHYVKTNYYYLQSEKWSKGNATIDFDHERFCKGSFDQVLSKSERDLELATTSIEVENAHTPVGIKYIHEFDGSGNIDVKQATIFHLLNASSFNVTGKVDSHSWETGKTLKLTAIHGERTLLFENDYEAKDKDMLQGSKIKWADDVWINYDVHITNRTTADTESQQIVVNVWYPRRSFNLDALYNLQDTMLDGQARLNWNVQEQNKTAELKGHWDNPPTTDGNVHNVGLSLSHPSFHKDVTLKGQYISTPSVMSNVSLNLQYSDQETEHLKFQSILTDNSNGPIRDYKFALTCSHPATNLDLEMLSEVNIHSHWYYLNNYYKFKKILFYEKLRHTKLIIDTNKSIVRYERVNETDFVKINSSLDLTYPDYKLFTLVDRNTGNDTGLAVLSMKDKSLVAHFNSTDDISYHMVGMIEDTRSAKLNAWRDYDDVTTVDVASYIRLNHSRLLTSSIVWRPEIFVEVKSQALGTLKHIYGQINESLVIVKQAPMEAHLALKNIWADAKPKMREFLEDLNDLHVIKDDLDEFQLFLNSSYENNDFYVKDIVEFVYNVLDEMAIKNQLESLPGILNDVWGLMGNTGQSLKDSLTFVISKVKQAYANFLESVNKVLEADLMELLSGKLEEAIMKYDNFVKDLHAKFLQYWETTWVNAINRLNKYWHEILKSIEPMIYKILHFFETISFSAWKNLMDFFYNRTQEITDSKYFNYVAAFGQELDHLYKDLVNNDLMTNIKKYTKKLWNNIWSKIEKYIPFQEEISSLYTEFKNAWDNFLKTPQVTFFTDKYKEARDRLKWWYDYFYIGEAFSKITEIVYEKLTQIAKTALIYEEEHRTPKTNFVFDPRKGNILLEQKLPMSWHAFNRTPDFSEIPEYKAVRQVLDDLMTTNKSLWHYINEFRPYLDMNNVLPPFGGMAMLTGQGTIVTFDKRVFTISQTGTFLLTKDYKENNFTVLMESNEQGRYNLITLTKNNVVRIDLYRQEVSIGESVALTLPAVVDECLIDRDMDTVTVQGQSGIQIQCNFLFKTCKIQISGWYYALVGGLFGTFNNEQYDDMQLTNNTYTKIVTELGHSWNLEAGSGLNIVENHEYKNDVQCDKFFQNKVSPLHRCFSVIDVTPFFEECISGVEACALASTYLEMCSQEHIPINIPEQCVQCTSPQGDVIEEGSFYEMKYVPSTTDVVFIVEAQFCNKNIRKTKNLDIFIEAFDSKLQGSGLSDNRYSVVGYGGSGIYKKPRSLYVNNKVFTNAVDVSNHFDNLVIEKRDSVRRNSTHRVDVFEALNFASTLPFRAAVSRTFILMPCTNCDEDYMRLDYPTIHQNLMDNSITLHILMDDNLVLSKTRASKYLFGIDNSAAYTNKDYENLVGNVALRNQVKLPKENLGLCSSLAMETNGTIFSGKKLQEAKPLARRLSTVFGARAAQSARSCNEPAQCECREARLDCRPCSDRQRLLSELSSFWSDDIEDLLDVPAIDPMLGN